MRDVTPRPQDLDPIETASRDELAALQLERLRWSLRHAYDNVAFYRRHFDTWADVMARSIRASGGRPGDRVHVAYGYGLFTGGLGAHYGAERLGCTVIPVSGGVTGRQVQLIRDLEPDVVMVTPSYLLAILDEMERQGVDPRATSLQVGIFGAEPWTEEMRREIEQRVDMHAVDIYGLSVWEDHFYPEVVDPETGAARPDGEHGELVLTSLTKEAMPVIRYRTRDLTRLLPGTARTMRRMEKVTGRNDDMIILRGVNLFPTQVEELVLRTDGLGPHFLLVLTRPGRLDELTVQVEARPQASNAERDRIERALQVRIRETIGVIVRVEVLAPETLERSAGKAQRVKDLRTARR